MSRRRMVRFKCGHEGCTEYAHYEVTDRAHAISLEKQNGNGRYRCSRHSQMEEMLSSSNPLRITEATVTQMEHGRYWGTGRGFIYGLGFRAFAADFPAGTVIRVTAEIVPPTEEQGGEKGA